ADGRRSAARPAGGLGRGVPARAAAYRPWRPDPGRRPAAGAGAGGRACRPRGVRRRPSRPMTLGPEWTAPSTWSRLGWLLRILIGVLLFWLGGFLHFVDDVVALKPAPEDRATDGIVALTGGAERIEAGLKLLAAGEAKR